MHEYVKQHWPLMQGRKQETNLQPKMVEVLRPHNMNMQYNMESQRTASCSINKTPNPNCNLNTTINSNPNQNLSQHPLQPDGGRQSNPEPRFRRRQPAQAPPCLHQALHRDANI
jgi:hypothetical protein